MYQLPEPIGEKCIGTNAAAGVGKVDRRSASLRGMKEEPVTRCFLHTPTLPRKSDRVADVNPQQIRGRDVSKTFGAVINIHRLRTGSEISVDHLVVDKLMQEFLC